MSGEQTQKEAPTTDPVCKLCGRLTATQLVAKDWFCSECARRVIPMTILDAPSQYDPIQASIWAVGYNKGYLDATNELRSEGAATGATAPGGAGEEQAQAPEAPRNGGPGGGETSEKQGQNDGDACSAEKATPEVHGSGECVLEGGKR